MVARQHLSCLYGGGLDEPMIAYAYDQRSAPVLALSDQVLVHFRRRRQMTPLAPESGGQLFARFGSSVIQIERATGPRRSDRSSPYSFRPNRRAERREIGRLFGSGLHFVGDWHTHHQVHPRPSRSDEDSILQEFESSRHELPCFVLVIVGTAPPPRGLFVCTADPEGIRELVATSSPIVSKHDLMRTGSLL